MHKTIYFEKEHFSNLIDKFSGLKCECLEWNFMSRVYKPTIHSILTNTTEQSLSWEADDSSDGPETSRF